MLLHSLDQEYREGRKMLYVEIDCLVPCLVENGTGNIIKTSVLQIKNKQRLSKYNSKTGWYANWSDLLDENEVYAIITDKSDDFEGLVALRSDSNMQAVFVSWMVAAPHNNPQSLSDNGKVYEGVGGHLFAIASKKSLDFGYGGAITGFAANKKLMDHYCNVFHSEPICMLHPYQIFIPEEEGKKIQEVYTYDWKNCII